MMETEINIRSKLFQEMYKLTWRIENFDTMPFCDNHPVCGPCFLLGKHRDSTWTLLMIKQMQEGVENVGFRLVRAEDDTSWNMVTLSLSVMMEDGRLVKCIDKEVLGGDSQNQYFFLIPPSKTNPALDNEMGTSTRAENICSPEGSVKASTIETRVKDCEVQSAVKEAIPEAKPIEVIVCPKSENGCGIDGSNGLDESNFKRSNVQEAIVVKPDAVSGLPKVEKASQKLILQPKVESCGIGESEVQMSEVQENGAELKPEELLKLKDLTVVCSIEYTYIMCKTLERNDRFQSDLMDVFKHLHTTGEFSDVSLKCEDVNFPCHKAILCPRSAFFYNMLKSDHQAPVTVMLHMQLHIAKAFILFMYTGELPDSMSADDYKRLCYVANYFGVRGMKQGCQDLMKGLEYEECCLDEEDVSLDKVSSPTKKQPLATVATDVSEKLTPTEIPEASMDPTDVANSSTQTSTSS